MNDRDIEFVKQALEDAIAFRLTDVGESQPDGNIREYQRILSSFNREVWGLEIYRQGELWDYFQSPDPSKVLEWAVRYRDWETQIPEGTTPVEAFELIRHEWDAMDISYTDVIKRIGDVEVIRSEHGEGALIRAARQYNRAF